jgi:hypothetical protein
MQLKTENIDGQMIMYIWSVSGQSAYVLGDYSDIWDNLFTESERNQLTRYMCKYGNSLKTPYYYDVGWAVMKKLIGSKNGSKDGLMRFLRQHKDKVDFSKLVKDKITYGGGE